MPTPRYEREQQRIAGPKFTRGVLKFYAIAAAIGLIIGLIWVLRGVLHFHPLW